MNYILEINDVSHDFREAGGVKKVLNHVNLKIAPGETVSLVGPSGCGKSTLLRAILGTHPPTRGQILAGGEPVLKPSRNIGIVYQDYRLYEFMTAEENVAFGPMLDQTTLGYRFLHAWKGRKLYKRFLEEARAYLEKVKLGEAIHKYPGAMSGGMRQRVAIAQALIMKPRVLLLDEPFGALDEATREDLQKMLLHIYAENLTAKEAGTEPPYTIIIVTHELQEAIYVSDRVVGLSQFHPDGANGATVCYDQASFVWAPEEERDFDFAEFHHMKTDIREAVFTHGNCADKSRYITFWDQYAQGKANGVMQKGLEVV